MTIRHYQRYIKYNLNPAVKSSRRQYPHIKRNSRHRYRHNNAYADELQRESFNLNTYRHNYKEHLPAGTLRNGRYHLEAHFLDFDKSVKVNQSKRAKLQGEILKRRREKPRQAAGKNGLQKEDLFLMAWKMLKRRGTTEPFRGHRPAGVLFKRELIN